MRWIKALLSQLPIPNLNDSQAESLAALGRLRSYKSALGMVAEMGFIEDLIDACIFEIYFNDHMKDRNLLVQAYVKELLKRYNPQASESEQLQFIESFYQTANAPDHPIRNRLLRLTADSPDLLAVIKEHGAV